jgi:hypothetical protein
MSSFSGKMYLYGSKYLIISYLATTALTISRFPAAPLCIISLGSYGEKCSTENPPPYRLKLMTQSGS